MVLKKSCVLFALIKLFFVTLRKISINMENKKLLFCLKKDNELLMGEHRFILPFAQKI